MTIYIAVLHRPQFVAELIAVDGDSARSVRQARGSCPDEALRRLGADKNATVVDFTVTDEPVGSDRLTFCIEQAIKHAEANNATVQ